MKDLWVSVSGAIAAQQNVETIANNVANANTPGFKRDQLTFKEQLTALTKGMEDVDLPQKEWAPEDFYRSYGAEDAYVKVDGSHTIHEQGQLSPTSNPLDLALSGKGFFEVQTPNGIRYTRKGNFSIGKDGSLVTDQGFPVLSRANLTGTEIIAPTVNLASDKTAKNEVARMPANQIPTPEERKINVGTGGKISITRDGEVYLAGNKIADLSVIEFIDGQTLRKEGNSLYINNDFANVIKTPPKTAVHQGFVEESNVNAVTEMSNLIKANRQFESIQRAIKAYDGITGRSVNEIGKF